MAPTATPTPTPALAPVLKPLLEDAAEVVGGGVVVVAAGGEVVVVDGALVAVDRVVWVAVDAIDVVVEVEGLARVMLWLIACGVVCPSMKMLKKNVLEMVRFILPRSITQVKCPPKFVTLSNRKAGQ